ncbi:MAG TPA: hypothetical protein VFV52_15505 [Bacilli bacterium]|nr:hypothetical protein [Bacilli bacterium]
MTLFYTILVLHLIAVFTKLAVLFYIPRLKDVEAIRNFLGTYKKIDRYADTFLWATGIGMVLATSIQLLLQVWLLVSMFLYLLIFVIVKRVVVRRMEQILASNKVYAREEIKRLRFENYCVIVAAVLLLGAIGSLMMTKPNFL